MNTKNIFTFLLITVLSVVTVSTLHFASATNMGGPFSNSQGINSQAGILSTSQPNIQVVQDSTPSNKQVTIDFGAASGGPRGPCVIANNCFNPNVITISPGSTVTWTNTDGVFHTVTSGKPTDSQVGSLFDRSISPGNSISIAFNSPQTVNYFCKIHPWLVGHVTVGTGSPSNGTISQNITSSQGGILSSNSTIQPNTNSNFPISQNTKNSQGVLLSSNQTQSLGGILSGQKSQADFKADMRKLWEDHIIWTRVFIISAVSNLGDTNAATTRLLQNQDQIGNEIKPYYGNYTGNQLASLLKTHITTAAELVTASKAGNTASAATAEKNWYANADQIAAFLAKINPSNWPEQSMKNMLDAHLAITKQEAVARLIGNWTGDIMAFDEVHRQALMMADGLSNGIIAQFPQNFTK